ncbi:YcaO-like family protein [Pararhizobium sp. YC-54]|uniref:YcaO-like family protein n=1 Tax=Pararhizobium sp. YC-54 TaxID=2986920 RepID=UPI0021F74C74|nr:YcaO-like family protein [Pararhizobium sp. YC-54]MCV9999757.1 YcaO-like family protein [Pararhizobium sp. YC-54]
MPTVESGPPPSPDLTKAFEILLFKAAVEPVHLAVAFPRSPVDKADDWLPPAARPEAGRIAAGRGLTRKEAYLSCLGEAAELASASFWGDEAVTRAKYSKVNRQALHPASLLCTSDAQYDQRAHWNAVHGAFDWMPARFNEDEPIDWIEATTPDKKTKIWVPAAYAYIGYFEAGDERAFAIADSNGCAAGASQEDAVIAAFLELVERDATALWWYGRHPRPAFDQTGLQGASTLVASLADRRRNHHLLDLTTDLGIPVCAAISFEPEGDAVAIGVSAHFDASRAAVAALTEMLQIEFSLEMRKAAPIESNDGFQFWLDAVRLQTMPHLLPADRRKNELVSSLRGMPPTIQNCVRICHDAGLQFLMLDLTRPAIRVPAVRVIVPGLRTLRRRCGDGRLFDVPVRQGWCDTPQAAEDLNVIPLSI